MTSVALRPAPRGARRRLRRRGRARRLTTDVELISVAGAVGSPVLDRSQKRVGTLDDLVVRWDPADRHPPLDGVIVRIHHRRTFVPAAMIAELRPDRVVIDGPVKHRLECPPDSVPLAHDVLDRQIVDVDGSDVTRVSDLVLGRLPDGFRLLGGDATVRTLLRRLGPALLRRRVDRDRVYDWASVGAFSQPGQGDAGSVLRLTDAAARLRERGPVAAATLLEDLPANERAALADHAGAGS